MKIEIVLQFLNILLTFVIGVFIALHLGKFNYKKKKREDLMKEYISLNQSIRSYCDWHKDQFHNLIFYNLIQYIKNLSLYSDDREFDRFFSLKSSIILDHIFNSYITKIFVYPEEISDELLLESSFFIYKGKNPYYYLELFLLKLSDREAKRLSITTSQLYKELVLLSSRFDEITKIFSSYHLNFSKKDENLFTEAFEIFNNWKMNLITVEETSDQIIELITVYLIEFYKTNKGLTVKYSKFFDLTDEYKSLFIKL